MLHGERTFKFVEGQSKEELRDLDGQVISIYDYNLDAEPRAKFWVTFPDGTDTTIETGEMEIVEPEPESAQ